MGCCWHGYHGPWYGGPPWRYQQTPVAPPTPRRRRRRGELEEHLDYLEDELKRVREELEAAGPTG